MLTRIQQKNNLIFKKCGLFQKTRWFGFNNLILNSEPKFNVISRGFSSKWRTSNLRTMFVSILVAEGRKTAL